MKEKFRKIPSLKFLYEVSKDGVIRNVKSKKILKPRTTPNSDYLHLHTTIKDKSIDIGIHRLVAECWVKIPEKYKEYSIRDLEINHRDFNRKNNNYKNLEWCTRKENMEYSQKAGRLKGINKGHIPWNTGQQLHEEIRNKISEAHKCKNKIKAVDIKTKEEFIFDDLDAAELFIRNKLNKESTCVRTQILRGCKGERKVVYKHNWYFI